MDATMADMNRLERAARLSMGDFQDAGAAPPRPRRPPRLALGLAVLALAALAVAIAVALTI